MSKQAKYSQTEADIILNRANIALARSQKLIESWLPPQTTVEEPRHDDDLKNEPETLGVGAQAKDDAFDVKRKTTNTKLLEQLIGKRAAQGHLSSKGKPAPAPQEGPAKSVEQDSGDEHGRAASIKQKRKRDVPDPLRHDDERPARKVNPKSSYLDEILAAKSKKARRDPDKPSKERQDPGVGKTKS